MNKQIFYFGDLDLLLKQEYFKDQIDYEKFLKFVENIKTKKLKTNEVVQFQYKDNKGIDTPILLSENLNAMCLDYVCHIDKPQILSIKNHDFSEIKCNIRMKSGWFGLLCVSDIISNTDKLIQDRSKAHHNGLVFSINSDEDKLDYNIRTFDVNEEAYCQSCNQYEYDDTFAQRSCNCNCNNGVIINHYKVYAHEVRLNNKRLFVFSS